MIISSDFFVDSLGKEPMEIFGFTSEEELETALLALMQEKPEEISLY